MGCGTCGCETKFAEDKIRDLITWVAVKKKEEVEGVSTCIEPKTAKELVKMLEGLAKEVS
ncbi:hypothetical protein HYT52_00595 [Candidatus Woesearchaeota archaeon]|nr:hypothetical protein [Candidatus Woesearchaeota archaeon]